MEVIQDSFGTTKAGQQVTRVKLRAGQVEAHVIDYGATITSVNVVGKDDTVNIALCHQDMGLLQDRAANPYFGATCGRVCNISAKQFEIEGQVYPLAPNFGTTGNFHLHGGNVGFDQRMWKFLRSVTTESYVAVSATSTLVSSTACARALA